MPVSPKGLPNHLLLTSISQKLKLEAENDNFFLFVYLYLEVFFIIFSGYI